MFKRQNIPDITHSASVTKMLMWLIALIVVGSKVWQVLSPGMGLEPLSTLDITALLILGLGMMLTLSPIIRINRVLALFILWSFLTLLFNDIGVENRAFGRLANFILVTALISPLLSGDTLTEIRLKMWRALMIGLRLVILLSFVKYLSWVYEPHGVTEGFCGVAGHPMALGIIATVVMLDLSWRMLQPRSVGRIHWVGIGLLVALSVIEMIASGSRCAVVSAIIGLIVQIWGIRHSRLKVLWGGITIGIIAVLIFAGGTTSEIIRQKNEIAASQGSVTFSRDMLWSARISEFCSKPITGVGFDVTYDLGPSEYYYENGESAFVLPGTREPGSSWLHTLSSTGIIGFLLIALFNFILLRKLCRCVSTRYRTEAYGMGSLLLALWFHGIFEGWLLYAGSMTFMIYWLLSSRIFILGDCSQRDIEGRDISSHHNHSVEI